MQRKILLLVVILVFGLSTVAKASGTVWEVFVNGQEVKLKSLPVEVDDELLVPVRETFERLGVKVRFNQEDKSLKISGASGQEISLKVNEKEALVNKESRRLEVPPRIIEGNLFVPLKFVAQALEVRASIDETARTICINPQVVGVKVEKLEEKLRIAIVATALVQYKLRRLTGPERLVIDLPHTYLALKAGAVPIKVGVIRKVRTSQFQVKPYYISRVVVELAAPLNYQLSLADNGSQVFLDFSAQVTDIIWKKEEGKIKITISGTSPLKFRTFLYEKPWRLGIDFSDCILAFKGDKIPVNEEPVKQIRYAQFKVSPDIVRVVVDLTRKASYKISSLPDSKEVVLEVYLYNSYLYKKKIVVDPGHGGIDPGAKGVSLGILEKDINLEVGLILADLLSQAGVEVLMTRTTDDFITLDDRVALANDAQADLFVSIHSNAFPANPNRSGTENYYFSPEGKVLAKNIHQELLKILCLPDQGVRKAKFVVIKDTTMPAVLVEVAYLTNPSDEALLAIPEFRQKAALGIFKGIVRYLESKPEEEIPGEDL